MANAICWRPAFLKEEETGSSIQMKTARRQLLEVVPTREGGTGTRHSSLAGTDKGETSGFPLMEAPQFGDSADAGMVKLADTLG